MNRIALAVTWILAVSIGGCSNAGTLDDESVGSVEAALEMEDGGFTLEETEPPVFGVENFEAWYADMDPLTEPMDGAQPLALDPADEPPADACAFGALMGRYRALREGLGVGRGRVLSAEREVIGHMRLIWGTRRDGTKVAFGKVIDLEGTPRALFRGVAEDGHFAGRWIRRNGNHGVMAGRYGDPRRIPGGVFAGRWHRVDCDEVEPADTL